MIKSLKKFWPQAIIIGISLVFFWQFLFRGLLPIPSDTIVGLYHPFRDLYARDYPRGVPFKNFLITDPVRQIIPWKSLSLDMLSRFQLPLWNPYEMAGKPLLANFQSSPFYPLNIILLLKPFEVSWSLFIMLQPLLAGIFMFVYLKNLKLDPRAAVLGSVAFSFSGFAIAWLEWGNIVHTALWLPLILLSVDRLFEKNRIYWTVLLTCSFIFSFFGGHLQIFSYVFLLSIAYFIFRFFEKKSKVAFGKFILALFVFVLITSIQWIPTLQFLTLSARTQDQNYLNISGWFIPLQHLVQFIVPDFFGNPSTLNYWGTWNYGELVGYVGIITLLFVIISLISKINKTKLFFATAIVVSFLFAVDNPIARIPFQLNLPFISTIQPTRLIFISVFGLSVLSAFGFDNFVKQKKQKNILIATILMIGAVSAMWLISFINPFRVSQENLAVIKRNLLFPTLVIGVGLVLIAFYSWIKKPLIKNTVLFAILALIVFDLCRFGWKFIPFTNPEYFYPQTKVIEFLKRDKSIFRIAMNDSRILAPNISTYYKIQSIEGYDSFYLKSYAELIAGSEREDHSMEPPYGFNRIITPHNMNSQIINLLNVKYILSLSNIDSDRFHKVLQEGETRVYENISFFPRAFFVSKLINLKGISFAKNLRETAFMWGYDKKEGLEEKFHEGNASIIEYSENKIVIKTKNDGDGFLILSDAYYPTWKVKVDNNNSKIYQVDQALRGVRVSKGEHVVIFYNGLF